MLLTESAALGKSELVVNVRTAKDQLSSLLEQAAQGNEIIITSDGKPKARLVPVRSGRTVFRTAWTHLKAMPPQGKAPAQAVVREDRDGRD